MSTSRTASRPWPAMWAAAALVLAIAAGRATAAELLAVSDSEPAAADAAPATPWRIFAVSSDRSTFTPGPNALGVRLAAGDRASCTRNLGLDDAKGLVLRFNVSLTGPADGGEADPVLRVGSGFGDANADEADVRTFGRLGLRSTSATGAFQLRDLAGRRSSATFTGTQAVTWALNATGGTIHYAAPDGSLEPLANDHMDVWVGREKVFDEMVVTRPAAGLADLKWYWGNGSGASTMDHLDVGPLEDGIAATIAPLPAPAPEAAPAAGAAPAANEPALELYKPSPNPFARTTRLAYAIAAGRERVEIGVYDVAGRKVRALVNSLQSAGRYEVAWDGRNDAGDHVHDGIYFLRAAVGTDLRIARIAYLVK